MVKSYKSKSRNFRENRSLLCDKLGWLPIASQRFSQPHSSSSSFTKLAQRIKWSKSFFVDTSTSQKCLEAVSPIDTPRRKHDPKSFGAQKRTSQHRTFILQNNSSRLIGETWVIAFRRGAKQNARLLYHLHDGKRLLYVSLCRALLITFFSSPHEYFMSAEGNMA